MKPLLRNVAFLCSAVFILQTTQAQILLGTGGYTQDFLNYSGNSGGQPTGWSVSCPNFRGQGDGNSNTGGAWSYGPSGSSERALGYLGAGTSANYTATVSFINNTGVVINGLNIAYDFEQWRTAGGNTNGFNVTESGIGASVAGLSQLSFNSTPNLPYIVNKSISLTNLSIAPGATFSLTWSSSDGAGNDNAKAIDNFSIMPVIVVPGCNPASTPDLSFNGTAEACAGNAVDLTTLNITDNNNTTGSFGYYSNPSATLVVPNPSVVTNSGTYYLVKTTSSGNCTDTLAIPVTIHPLPDATISGQNIVCENAPLISLSAATPGGTWSGTGIVNPSSGDFDPSVSGSGTFQVTYDITVNNCQSSDIFFITVDPTPDATISGQNIVCENAPVISLSAATPGGAWSGTGIVNPSSGDFDPAVSGSGIFQVIYDITVNNCHSSDTFLVTVNPTPDAQIITPDTLVCESNTVFTLLTVNAGGVFSGPGIINPALGDFDIVLAGQGTHQVMYHILQNGCADSDMVQVVVMPTPDATILSHDTTICSGNGLLTLAALNSGGFWSGPGITNSTLGLFDPLSGLLGTNTIVYQLTSGMCTHRDTVFIQVNASPVISIPFPGDFCTGGAPVQFTANPSGGQWSGNFINSSGIFLPAQSGAGTFPVVYAVTQNGCTSTDTLQVVVNQAPQISFSIPDSVCLDTPPFMLQVQPSGGSWTGNGVNTNGMFSPQTAGLGLHTFQYLVSNGSCSTSATQPVFVENPPVAGFSFTTNGLDVDFYGALSVNSTFSWNYGDGTQGTGQNSEHFYPGAGTYTVILYVTNFCGVDTFQRTVTVGNSAIESYEENTFRIWPVPADDVLNIHCENDVPFMATIWDINGKQVQGFTVVKSAVVDIATLAPGMYIIRMESAGTTGITRFIKR